ncbi:luciferin 4-monooxygenase-like [Zerene cesonia]|uniref:luciferin 4-monooxygenase-like n=1 Tax=Zerene cesonia TaxID=33412 RepID=UPI0018E5627F|nr:luciferin 4-monooxygenase-like [Zerene cesonia]
MVEHTLRPDYHIGHVLVKAMQQHSALLYQIDGATGETETFGSVLSRSIHLSKCLRNFGLNVGDVVAVGGWNHLDISIPIYSAIFNGMISVGVSPYYKYHEIKDLFTITKPKIAFCERNLFKTYIKVTEDLKLNTKIVAFGHGDDSWSEFIEKYDDDEEDEKFKIGTNSLHLAPVNSIGNYLVMISLPLLGQCKVQSSIPDDINIVVNMINKYKPISSYLNPHMLAEIIKRKDLVDLTCMKECMSTDSDLFEHMGQTETLVDPESGDEVTEPNVLGEMWIKGPCLKEYYNDPEETQKVFSKDGYVKTGDLYYRDENDFYYFSNRIKTIIKWRGCTVLPGQIEDVIRTHEGVKDVCVVGIGHPEDGERPTACIIREEGSNVTAQEIKDLVVEKLSVKKELRGGVVFFKEFPMTATGKIARKIIVDIVSNTTIE